MIDLGPICEKPLSPGLPDKTAAAVRDEAVQGRLSRQQADDRSAIAKIIVWAFVVLMAWTVVAVTLGMIFFEWEALSEPAKFLMTILSSVMLPVVTLVIGYYFGAEKN